MGARPLGHAWIGEAKNPPLGPLSRRNEIRAAPEQGLNLRPTPDARLNPGLLRFDQRPWAGPRCIQAGCSHERQILVKLFDGARSRPSHALLDPHQELLAIPRLRRSMVGRHIGPADTIYLPRHWNSVSTAAAVNSNSTHELPVGRWPIVSIGGTLSQSAVAVRRAARGARRSDQRWSCHCNRI